MSAFKKIQRGFGMLGTAWCMIGLCLALFVGIELALRAVVSIKSRSASGKLGDYDRPWNADLRREDNSIATEHKPFVEWRRKPFAGQHINIDQRGVRRTWSPPAPGAAASAAAKPYRIFVFGGSTIWGTGARDEATIPSCLAKQLHERGTQAEVVNLGETGYCTTQELNALIQCLQRGDVPNLAIFYDGINDTFSAYQHQVAGIPQIVSAPQVKLGLEVYSWNASTNLRGMERLANRLSSRVKSGSLAAGDRSAEGQQKLAADVVSIYEQNIKIIEALAAGYHFDCQFFWQPVLFTKQEQNDFEKAAASERADFKSIYADVYRDIDASQALKNNPRFHNISTIFDDRKEQLYVDFAHVTEEGNAELAKAMLEELPPIEK